MFSKKWAFFLFGLLLNFDSLLSVPYRGNNQVYTGPVAYHVNRVKKGGTEQNGWAYGGKIGYDRIKPWGFYWGAEGSYAVGKLDGKSSNGDKLKSNFYDGWAEGRFGFTFQQAEGYQFTFVPFIGGGYQWETNNFIDPSPLKVHTQVKGGYACAGFLSKVALYSCFRAGIDFKAKFLIDAYNHISHDPDFSDSSLLIKNEYQYKIELPLEYVYRNFNFGVVPFYEYRHYGGKAGFPFDFVDTRLNLWGAFLKLTYFL